MTTPKHPCDCLDACGDDPGLRTGRVAPCQDMLKRQAENRRTEGLEWVNPTPNTMPDADTTVLCELTNDAEAVWPGYWTGEQWRSIDGSPFAGTVTGWAPWPQGRRGQGVW